jgi:hypothetical protein
VSESVLRTLTSSGFANEIGNENIFPHILPAMEKATQLSKKAAETSKKSLHKTEASTSDNNV